MFRCSHLNESNNDNDDGIVFVLYSSGQSKGNHWPTVLGVFPLYLTLFKHQN